MKSTAAGNAFTVFCRRSQQVRTWQQNCNARLLIAIKTHMQIAQVTNQTYLFLACICNSVIPTVLNYAAPGCALMSADASTQ